MIMKLVLLLATCSIALGQGQGRGGPSGQAPPDDGHGSSGSAQATAVYSGTTTTYLFNLANDLNENTNLAGESAYATTQAQLAALHQSYASSVVQPTSIDYQTAYTYFTKCGGVCSYVTNDVEASTITTAVKPPHKTTRDLKKSSSKTDTTIATTSSSSSSSPNIVFVLVDDWGWNDVGWRSTYLSWTTPNIDRLASEGVKLDNYFTAYVCLPARSSLMTGRYAFRQGTWSNSYESELPIGESTLAQELKEVGYQTYMVGKWHLGFTSDSLKPTSRGFDEYYGFLTGKVDYWSKNFNNKYLDLQDGNSLVTNAAEISSDTHNSYLLQSKAEGYIASHASNYGTSKPMFLYYSMQMIHSNLAAPDVYIQRCHKPKDIDDDYYYNLESNYCAMNIMVDEAVANLTCTLDKYGYSDNTYLIVASDNGGDKSGVGSSYPFKGQKGSGWNGGVKATAFIHSNLLSTSVRGSTYTGLMHVTDWLPTLMNVATNGEWKGTPISGLALDGVDNWASVSENKASARSEIVHYHDGTSSVIQVGDYKLFTMDDSIECGCKIASPAYIFAEDEDPSASSLICTSPSLMKSTWLSSTINTLLVAIGGKVGSTNMMLDTTLGGIIGGVLTYFFDFVYALALVMFVIAIVAAMGLMVSLATDKMLTRGSRMGVDRVDRMTPMEHRHSNSTSYDDKEDTRKEFGLHLSYSEDQERALTPMAPHEGTKLLS